MGRPTRERFSRPEVAGNRSVWLGPMSLALREIGPRRGLRNPLAAEDHTHAHTFRGCKQHLRKIPKTTDANRAHRNLTSARQGWPHTRSGSRSSLHSSLDLREGGYLEGTLASARRLRPVIDLSHSFPSALARARPRRAYPPHARLAGVWGG